MPNYSGMWNLVQQLQATAAGNWPAPPGVPTSVSASAGNQQATVSFTAPTYTGNPAGITGYRVTISPGGATVTGALSPIIVTGLTNDVSYTFTVAALGASGYGAESAPSNAVTPSQFAVEDVFSTYLYTGNNGTQTITNGLNLSGQGGLVWLKGRSGATDHFLYDTNRGPSKFLSSNNNGMQVSTSPPTYDFSSFNSNGFSLGIDIAGFNTNGTTYASWSFRKSTRFFDVVTYTGDGVNGRQIPHNLGVTPGMVIVKRVDSTGGWKVWHVGSNIGSGLLNSAASFSTNNSASTDPRFQGYVSTADTTTFTVNQGTSAAAIQQVNESGGTYVAYVFAHDTAADGIIQCGFFVPVGSPVTVTLGWEPQWLLIKDIGSTSSNWEIVDNMRGLLASGNANQLAPNTSNTEGSSSTATINSTGFGYTGTDFRRYIYVAIRRGPMKTPTSGTSVFQPFVNYTSIANQTNGTIGPVDMTMQTQVPTPLSAYHFTTFDRLRGSAYLTTSTTSAEAAGGVTFDTNIGVKNGTWFTSGGVGYNFRRAPSFMDVVCWTGDGVEGRNIPHNLTVVPELIITKNRSSGNRDWYSYHAALGNTKVILLDLVNAAFTYPSWDDTTPTSSVFRVRSNGLTNQPSETYVAYLFASCPGVSKVGSYTGTGTTQTINCGFTTGARFVLIKRTDSTGDWYVWDSARGIVAGNDPYLLMNNPAAEVTNTDYVDTDNSGFQISSTAPAGINANGGTYIFLAVA